MGGIYLALLISVISMCFSVFLFIRVKRSSVGTEKMVKISNIISLGASAYLRRQYKTVSVFFGVVFLVLLLLSFCGVVSNFVPYIFLLGGIFSAIPGYLGMKMATIANVRTAAAAEKSLSRGLKVAFSAGASVGFIVVGVGLFGICGLFLFLNYWYTNVNIIETSKIAQNITSEILTFGMGVSCMALFARVGGGIFTKAADVGADLVGKVEVGIPEDDPRNPAVIADNVGDNVGDVAGMGADLFESYIGGIISSSALAIGAGYGFPGVILPMVLAGVGIIVSIIGALVVRVKEKATQKELLASLTKGTYLSSGLMLISSRFIIKNILPGNMGLFWAVISGLLAGLIIGLSTEYFTSSSYQPVKSLSRLSQTGAGTFVIGGLSVGMISTVIPVVTVSMAVLISFLSSGGNIATVDGFQRGLYGIAIAAVGMLSTLGVTLATDAYGPIADNAGGIAEMSGMPPEVRVNTDLLDSLGNTTAATGKGYAVGSAALTTLALVATYLYRAKDVAGAGASFDLTLINPAVLIGLFVGAMIPYLFGSYTMDAVGKSAMSVVNEVRRQFKNIPGLMEGTAEPDYSACVDICASSSLRLMLPPAAIGVGVPIITGIWLGVPGVLGLMVGATVSGFVLAIMMANAGGAWDNAKKYIESGAFGGKGSDAHKAAVVGDTVGDPFKDTSGPSINILIKLIAMVSIVFVGVAVSLHFV
ncbi:MAG: sodium-translocating pyrophosphatase [Candidatus Improbicoccus devescovinae]|nr:MAG: sodium-translocating pyrophosphatase [Candidatus Improbicoccus devescovinae]